MRLLLILLSILILPAKSKAQWGLRTGWTHTRIQDLHSSPLEYGANTADLSIVYRRLGEFQLTVGLTVGIGGNQSVRHGRREAELNDPVDLFGNTEGYVTEINPALSMLRVDWKVDAGWRVTDLHGLGMQLRMAHTMSGIGADNWHLSQLSLGPRYFFTATRGKTILRAEAGLPLVGVIVRPNWAKDAALPETTSYYWGYVRTNTRVVGPASLFNPDAAVGVEWPVGEGRTIGLGYRTRYLRYTRPRLLRSWEQGVELSYYF